LVNRLDDLDLCLLSETHGDMQTKLGDLTNNPVKTGLVVNVKETKAINTHKKDPFTLRDENIEDVDSFTYLAVWVIKMGELHRMSCVNSKSNGAFVQCGRTAEYLLGPNCVSSVVMLSWCCYMDLRHGKK